MAEKTLYVKNNGEWVKVTNPFSLSIGSVNISQDPYVTNSGTANNVVLDFGIPKPAVYTPNVTNNVLSFTNTSGLQNPDPVLLRAGIEDAPADGLVYGRRNNAWIEIPSINIQFMKPVNNKDYIIGRTFKQLISGEFVTYSVNKELEIVQSPKSYFDAHPIFGGIETVISDGNYMRKVPKFYISNPDSYTLLISPEKLDGFRIHPAFMYMGKEYDYFLIGQYMSTLANGKAQSVPNTTIPVSYTLPQSRSYAQARNVNGVTGFQIWNIYHLSALQMLFSIEYCSTNCRSAISGLTQTANNVSSSSALQIGNSYRGVYGLWGSGLNWIEGMGQTGGYWRVWDNKGNQTWQVTKTPVPSSKGYIAGFETADIEENYNSNDVVLVTSTNIDINKAVIKDYYETTSATATYQLYTGYYGTSQPCGIYYQGWSQPETYKSNSFPLARLAKYDLEE